MARDDGGILESVRDLVGALAPLSVRDLESELRDRLAKIPTRLNEYGYDPFGFHPDAARRSLYPAALLYRYYFRVEVKDIDRVPEGRVLLICNHAGQLPFDGMMLGAAMVLEAEPPRICRPMGEYWIPRIPFFNEAAARSGAMVGTPENCVAMLEQDEAVMVFPEGVRGMNKLYKERYRLQRFGLGFMRLALETDTPIVPVALVGSEEQNPGLGTSRTLARLLGVPAFPLTAMFPWLGPLGLLPLPVRYHFYFGEPLRFEGDPNDDDASIQQKVDVVRSSIESMFERGLAEREGVFR
ncbi:MAG: lysophospholipid acyltransferase family protein [Myxococcota bacterium]